MTKQELYKVTDILNDVLSNYLRGSEAEEVIAKLEESVEDSELMQEEPEYLQEETTYCAFSTSRYTDKERKALCKGCEEECRFNKKEDSVSEQNLSNVKRTGKNWKESVNENLGEAAEDFSKSTLVGSPYIKKNAFKAGANWKEQQMMAKAIDAHINYAWSSLSFGGFDWSKTGLGLGDKCKLIIIKED